MIKENKNAVNGYQPKKTEKSEAQNPPSGGSNVNKVKTNSEKQVKIQKFKDIEGKFLHIKVGTKESPATEDHIKQIEKQIVSLFEGTNINCLVFVTHHAVDISILEKQGE